MTRLPQIPSNLQPTLPTVPNLAPAIPQFPNLPTVTGVSSVPEGSSEYDAIKSANPLIKIAIPETVVDDLLEKTKEFDGSIDFNEVTTKLNANVNSFISASMVSSVTLPSISLLGALQSLIPTLPMIDIPSPVEVRQYVNALIEKKKIEEQQLITETQLRDAEAELTPFSSRKKQENDNLKFKINVSTFTNEL